MLLGTADLLRLKVEIVLIISSFEMKIESWLGGVKYSKIVLYENGTSGWTSGTII